MTTPEITVLTATHNDGRYIGQAIESVLNQTYELFEYIVIDDASTDETAEILKSYAAQDSRISVQRNEKKLGRGGARNRGLSMARGKWVAIFDGDDISHLERLERQWSFIAQNPDIDYIGAGCAQIDKQTGNHLSDRVFVPPLSQDQIMWQLCFDFPFHHSSTIGRKALFMSSGGYPIHLPVCEDIFLWMKMALNGARFANMSDQLLTYRVNTLPNHYALNQAIAEQLHRSFVEKLLGIKISAETFSLIWQTNSEWLYILDEHVSSVNAIEAIQVLTQLYDYFLSISSPVPDTKGILSNVIMRIAKITRLAFIENGNWVSAYHYGYPVNTLSPEQR
jgi:glycosyltransferase involved in cell wall biosynthesis